LIFEQLWLNGMALVIQVSLISRKLLIRIKILLANKELKTHLFFEFGNHIS